MTIFDLASKLSRTMEGGRQFLTVNEAGRGVNGKVKKMYLLGGTSRVAASQFILKN